MKKEFRFLSSDGKTSLYGVQYTPKGTPRAVVQITHGMIEYMGRYEEFAAYLADRGYAVIGHDSLGHGHSGSPKDWGYIAEPDPCGAMVEDIHLVRRRAQKQWPGLPHFLLGHSMGSYMARAYLVRHGEGLAGCVLSGTGFQSGAMTAAGLALLKAMRRFKGSRAYSALAEKLVFSGDYKRFDTTGKDPENSWLSKNTESVRKYYSDPMDTFRFTLNGYIGLISGVRAACDPKAAAQAPKTPLLIVSGADDPVGSFGKGVRASEAMYRGAGFSDVTMRLFEGDRHEILQETDRSLVFDCIREWLDRH